MVVAMIIDLLARRARTADELGSELGVSRDVIRTHLSDLVFQRQTVTCDAQGRYSLGDPTPLLNAGPRHGVPSKPRS